MGTRSTAARDKSCVATIAPENPPPTIAMVGAPGSRERMKTDASAEPSGRGA
jgi:hypothetical protein